MGATAPERRLQTTEKILYQRLSRAIKQFGKYCLVGASGYIVNLLIFSFLVKIGLHYLVAATVSFCVAATNNFLLNKYWTFGNPRGPALTQARRFLIISVTSWALNLVVLRLLIEDVNLNSETVAQAIAIGAVTILNFTGNKLWSFRHPTT
jgi:dolichol-phosphate mannosyltransferase